MAKVKKNKRSIIIVSFAVVLCVSFAISMFSLIRDIKEIDKKIADVELEIVNQVEENKNLHDIIHSGNKDDYVDGIARENGYVKPGERVYYDVSVND